MKKRKTAFLANSWMAKTEENVLFKGKGFLVRASGGKDVAMVMIGKWYVVENRMGGVSGFESRESISGIRWEIRRLKAELAQIETDKQKPSLFTSSPPIPSIVQLTIHLLLCFLLSDSMSLLSCLV